MAVYQPLTTLGMFLCYAVETTAGTRPTSGYTIIPGVKGTPDFDTEPENIDSTTLFEDEFRTSEPGLKDLGGAAAFEANFSPALEELVEEIVDQYETAINAGKAVWFATVHPQDPKCTYMKGRITKVMPSAASVADMLNTTIRIYPAASPFRAAVPTDIQQTITDFKDSQQGKEEVEV